MLSEEFDPNGPSDSNGIFGLPSTAEASRLLVYPVPFDATTSYGQGTADGPKSILKASYQKDLFHPIASESWKHGIFMLPENSKISNWNQEARQIVEKNRDSDSKEKIERVNEIGEMIFKETFEQASRVLEEDRLFAIIGGDHSVPLGSLCAHAKRFPKMGVLHIDAHYDLRKAYEGFEHSHASIMFNVLKRSEVQSITSVGVRDYCEEEALLAFEDKRVKSFLDDHLMERKSNGETWKQICDLIVESLPEDVYVSFDIDGLDPSVCPGTGTPVPGGLSFNEAVYLLRAVFRSGKRLVGFDLCEVGASEFDGNIGARILYELSVLSIQSQSRALD